ncbi:hypothetical protein [Oscillatoria acuminata]|uniref:Uncharacterized protein n=1 Tax=Oscillatoria acuminata PCC 6304 TaxID=56110 RepID=K9TCM3_9CYAN|nr:hypothetical protein [Oscillatoria acuminata]AFY80183.1 hypothetical protein Oscil6304_0434 [Oscillatoria acuminata PCC 6304]
MNKKPEWESLRPVPNKELIFGSAMIMIALLYAIKEIRTISLLLPLSTMSTRQLRRHFIRKAKKKLGNMTEDEFATFIAEHFNSDDFQN